MRDEYFRYTLRFSVQSLASCLVIVYGFGSGNGLFKRLFDAFVQLRYVRQIGLASYSIYLVHLTTMIYLTPLVSPLAESLRVITFIASGTLAGVGVYFVIERPIQKWRADRNVAEP